MARVLTLFFLSVFAISCRQDSGQKGAGPGGQKAPPPARLVQVATAHSRALERSLSVVGRLRAFEESTLGPKVGGRLLSFEVDLGDEVKAGQILARLEPRDYELEVKLARAAVLQARSRLGLGDDKAPPPALEKTPLVLQARALQEEADKSFKRLKGLSDEKIISAAELDAATAALTVAKTRYDESLHEARNRQAILNERMVELEIAEQKLTDTVLLAPYAGKIQERQGSPGQFFQAGTPILKLVRVNPLRLQLEVPDRLASRIHSDQRLKVKIDGFDREQIAQISRITPAINETNRILLVEADLPNDSHLQPGAFARAEIFLEDQKPAVTVPLEALLVFAGIEKVFVADQGKAVEKRVTTGMRGSNWVEIVSGVKGGESVVLNPGNLQNGQALILP